MSTETERLAQEAEAHRNRLDSTLDQLRSKLSPGGIIDEATAYLREGNGAELARNLGRQVRDNPIALGLVGAGIAWLFMGPGVRRGAGNLRDRYDEWSGDDEDGHSDYSGDQMANYTADAYLTNGAAGSGGSGHDKLDEARDKAAGMASNLKDRVQSAGDSLSHATSAAADRIRHGARDASDAVRDAGRATRRTGQSIGRTGKRLGNKARNGFFNTLRDEPLIVGAIAVAVGAAIGAALPSTRAEDRAVGRVRDRLRDDAIDYGKDAARRAGHVAEEAYRAADRAAGEEGLKPDGGKTLAERASSVATSAVDAAKEDAKKQGLG